ncbi:hypothetical protein BN59_00625 [Legionella massiliensis]|uniref:Uncharacterized protein n=1 Tax=Legionella massiliensis TaxID=1034943 RepID=A0A078KTR6_9GAMM|nr:hypothetical protein BN59_00625 [Legionella massiliensis]CEE12095.1 hypothetical protein BN1094_00625 [Legionella massiliensis]
MKQSKYLDSQILSILKQYEGGTPGWGSSQEGTKFPCASVHPFARLIYSQ